MADPIKPQDTARRKTSNAFMQAEQRDKFVRNEIEKERAASAAENSEVAGLAPGEGGGGRGESDKRGNEKAAAKASAKPSRRKPV